MPNVIYEETPNDPLVPLAQGPLEPIEFTCTRALQTLFVDQGGAAPEVAYFDGAFVGPYAASSISEDGLSVSAFREGGWITPPKLYPRLVPVPPVPMLLPALQPLAYAPRAAWALDLTTGSIATDRTGNGYTLNGFGFGTTPAMRLNKLAVYGSGSALLVTAGLDPTVRYESTPFTVGFMYASRGGGSFLIGHTTFASGFNNSWELFEAGGKLKYVCGNRLGGPMYEASTTLSLGSEWRYLSLRRNAARTAVRLGIDDQFITIAVTAAGASFNGRLTLGGTGTPAAYPVVTGPFGDAMIWDGELSDAQLIAQYKAAKGVP